MSLLVYLLNCYIINVAIFIEARNQMVEADKEKAN